MNVALRLPDSLGMSLKEFSKHENISMNQFIATAIAEKLSSLKTYDYLKERSDEGNAKHLLSMLNKVAEREADKFDRQKLNLYKYNKGGVYDISNRRRLGVTEVEAVQDMYDGVLALIEAEKAL